MWKLPDVIPAKANQRRSLAGIQSFQPLLDPGFRRGDGVENQILLKRTALVLNHENRQEVLFPGRQGGLRIGGHYRRFQSFFL
jgi:hypothetical protein